MFTGRTLELIGGEMEDDPLEHLPACRPNWKTKLPLVPSPLFGSCLCLGNHNAVYALDCEAKGMVVYV